MIDQLCLCDRMQAVGQLNIRYCLVTDHDRAGDAILHYGARVIMQRHAPSGQKFITNPQLPDGAS
jgi:hypothetical protein